MTGEIIRVATVQPDEIFSRGFRQRRFREELRPRDSSVSSDEAVFTEVFLVEEHRRPEVVLVHERPVDELAIAVHVDAEI